MNHSSPLLAGVGLVPRTAPQTPPMPPPPRPSQQQQLQQQQRQTTTSAPTTCNRPPPSPSSSSSSSKATQNNGNVILHINMQRNWSSNQTAPDSAEDSDDHEVQIVKQMPPQSSQVASQSSTVIAAAAVATVTSSPSTASQEFRGGLKIKSRPKKNGQVNIASHHNIEAVEKGSLIPGPTIIKQSQFSKLLSASNLESTNGTNKVNNSTTSSTNSRPTSQLPIPARVPPTSQESVTTSQPAPLQQPQKQRVSQQAKQTPLSGSAAGALMQQQPQSPTKQSSTQTETPILNQTGARPATSSTANSTTPQSPSSASKSKFEPRTPPLSSTHKVIVPEFITQNGLSVSSSKSGKLSGFGGGTEKSLTGHQVSMQTETATPTKKIASTPTMKATSTPISKMTSTPLINTTMTPIKKQTTDQISEATVPFTWEKYFELIPGTPAPKEAFMQSPAPLGNLFELNMKLEARDLRNSSTTWSLASVIYCIGDRIKIRCDGSDSMNDFFELVNSDNIRPCGSKPGDLLLPPFNYRSNISNYGKYVEKILAKPDTKLAPPEAFKEKPKAPPRNLFQEGMRLEAIDRKNPHIIFPATIGEVRGDEIRIVFDFWKGSFDYSCKYSCRDIFPINWCRDSNHPIHPPNAWMALVNNEKLSPTKSNRLGLKSQVGTATGVARNSLPLNKSKSPIGRSRLSHSNELPSAQAPSPSPQKQASTTKHFLPQAKTVSTASKYATKSSPSQEQTTASPLKPSILKKAEKRRRSPTPDSSCSMDDDATNDADVDDDTETDFEYGENYYQCQRTVPYNEWKRLKMSPSNCATKSEEVVTNMDDFKQSTTDFVSSNLEQKQQSTNVKEEEDNKPPKKKVAFSSHFASVKTVSDVVDLIKSDESLAKYSNVFETNEIDGKAFLLLTTDVMVNHMGLKIGPVLKINKLIEQVRRGVH